MIFTDTNIIVRSVQTKDPQFSLAENALATLRRRRETLCIAPQTLVEFWVVATRPLTENGLGMSPIKAAEEINILLRLFRLLPYTPEVLETWQHIVSTQGVYGKQAHDAHIVAMMHAHSVTSILTFNERHFKRFPGITVLHPTQI